MLDWATDRRVAMKDFVHSKRWAPIVEEFGTPLVVTDLDVVRSQCRAMIQAFPYARLLYSMKANYNPHVVKAITAEGFGIDAVSPYEVLLARRLGTAPEDIFYVENNMTDAEMREAVAGGVRLIIGSLTRLERFCAEFPNRGVGIRINGDVGGSQHAKAFTAGPASKFGIHYTQLADALRISQAANVRIETLHQHIGSGWLDQEVYLEAADILIRESARFPDLRCLDFGGGFGVTYSSDEHPIDLEYIGAKLGQRVEKTRSQRGSALEIALEPGRYLVAESAVLLARVNTRKLGSDGRLFLGLDTGFNHIVRPALYGVYHEIINASIRRNAEEYYDVCGNICESTDFFARQLLLPETKEGDVIAIMNVGAYGLAMASNYNVRPLPAEVVLDHGKSILSRRRQTLDDVLRSFEL
jgi:diaminopimelate decarboxylase